MRGVLTKHHGEKSNIEFELAPTINMETGEFGNALPPLKYTYMAGKKKKRSHVTFNYCPFCGKKEDEPKTEPLHPSGAGEGKKASQTPSSAS